MVQVPPIKSVLTILIVLFMFLLSLPVMAQEMKNQQGPVDPAELGAFLDDLMARQMKEHHIPGAVISVTRGGQLFFAKGYGYADIEKRLPVDPERTLFRLGSGTKLFTATAVMQLVEQGKLDLDTDINKYLDFKIPDTYPEAITLKHLLSHTAGFEASGLNIAVSKADDLQPMSKWLPGHMRKRVHPPGKLTAYSNYGLSLAGYIVERVSGVAWEAYIQQNILKPLNMNHTTAWQPLPAELASDYHTGYIYDNGKYLIISEIGMEDELEYIQVIPAGSMSASAADMANFMIMHLQNGRFEGTRIINEATARTMHGTLFTADPRINGMAYGFWELDLNGQEIIGHPGDTAAFHSALYLLPDRDIGIFAAWNADGGMKLNEGGFIQAFLDHYYPLPESPRIKPRAGFASRAGKFAGRYRMAFSSHSTFEKAFAILGSLKIEDGKDGTIVVNLPDEKRKFVEVEPLFFRESGGQDRVIFREDDGGQITTAFVHSVSRMAIEKLSWYQLPELHQMLLILGNGFFLSVVIVFPIGYFLNRRRGGSKDKKFNIPGAARLLLFVTSIFLVLFTIGLFYFIGTIPWYTLTFKIPLFFHALLLLPVLAALLTVVTLLFAVLIWKDRYWGIIGRVHFTVAVIATLAFIWSLNFLNLLGWRY